MKAKRVNLHARLETNAEIPIIHLVLIDIRVEEVEVAGDCEEKVVVVRRQFRELILQHLWGGSCALAFFSNHGLRFLGEKFVRQLPQPSLEHRSNCIDVIKIRLVKKIDVEFCAVSDGDMKGCPAQLTCIKPALPMLDFFTTTGYAVKSFFLAALVIEIADATLV
jgi:hypothetical protein